MDKLCEYCGSSDGVEAVTCGNTYVVCRWCREHLVNEWEFRHVAAGRKIAVAPLSNGDRLVVMSSFMQSIAAISFLILKNQRYRDVKSIDLEFHQAVSGCCQERFSDVVYRIVREWIERLEPGCLACGTKTMLNHDGYCIACAYFIKVEDVADALARAVDERVAVVLHYPDGKTSRCERVLWADAQDGYAFVTDRDSINVVPYENIADAWVGDDAVHVLTLSRAD